MNAQPGILNTLRETDRNAYLAALFGPEEKREAIAALWAFNAEIERIPMLVSEPLPGEIRLQWWRDVCNGMRDDEAGQHPVAAALLNVIKTHELPTAAFDRLCEARIFDLYNDPMPSVAALEGYLGETVSILFQLSVQILSGDAPENGDAAGHAGMALGIAQVLQKMARHRARGQVFVPSNLLVASGLSAETFLALDNAKQADGLVQLLVSMGRDHLDKAQTAIKGLPQESRAAFVLLGLCQPLFKRASKRGGAVALEPFALSPFTAQWYLTRYSLSL